MAEPETVDTSGGTADLVIVKGSDVDLDIEWWGEDGTTPISIASTEAEMYDSWLGTRSEVLPLADFVTHLNNVVEIRIPAIQTASIKVDRGVWVVRVVSTEGTTKVLVRGRLIVREGIRTQEQEQDSTTLEVQDGLLGSSANYEGT